MRAYVPVLVLLLAAPLSAAADFQAGLSAYEAGDYEAALREWTPLAEEGSPEAQFNLGLMYFHGHGVERDLQEAAHWYRMSADRGYAKAQFSLGDMYDQGLGIEQNEIQAHLWFNLARKQRFPGAKKRRNRVANRMTRKEIALAELGYREWRRKREEQR